MSAIATRLPKSRRSASHHVSPFPTGKRTLDADRPELPTDCRSVTIKRLSKPAITIPGEGMTELDFHAGVLVNPFNRELLRRLAAIGLGQCYLTAGCLFQTIWNQISGRAPEWGIKDYDVFYFDDRDLSWDAEDRVIREITEKTADLPVRVELRNQARVHLWYPQRFGGEYPQLTSTRSGIDLYLISCTCVGIDAQTGGLYAPNGLGDLSSGLLRQNPLNPKPELFRQKAESYQQRWPWLEIIA